MKILYAGDNRNRVNLGCRGTSIALSQLLSSKFDISGVIYGDVVSDPILIGEKLFPNKILNIFQKKQKEIKLFEYLLRVNTIQRNERDFINEDLSISLANFLKYKDEKHKLFSIYRKVKDCDALVVNGEGDMIFTTPPRRKLLFLLMLMELAHSLGKSVYYINAMVSDDPNGNRNQNTASVAVETLKKCKLVALRDPVSFNLVQTLNSDINTKFIPDALFTWQHYFTNYTLPSNGDYIIPYPEKDKYFGKFDFSEPYICIGGTSFTQEKEDMVMAYTRLANQIKKLGIKIYLIEGCTGDNFLQEVGKRTEIPCIPAAVPILTAGAILANAKLFISGRHHPSIFASLGGTPCVFLGSNSHKTKSLQEILNYQNVKEFSAFPTEDEVEEIVLVAKDKIAQGDSLRKSIIETVKQRSEESKQILELIN